jgi:hypothetical protein
MKLPRNREDPWWRRELPTTLIKGVPPLCAAVITASKLSSEAAKAHGPHELLYSLSMLSWAGLAWLLTATGVSLRAARAKDRESAGQRSPRDLNGCLLTLHAALLYHKGLHGNPLERGALRLPVHRVEGEHCEQLTPSAGGRGGPSGRLFSARAGLVGRAVTSGDPVVMHRPANQPFDDYIKELRAHWHMTELEAKQLQADRRSLMAMPLLGNGMVVGVVFADTSFADFFDETTQELMLEGHRAISDYVRERYGS